VFSKNFDSGINKVIKYIISIKMKYDLCLTLYMEKQHHN